MAKPTPTIDWCSTGTATEPDSGKKATGWVNLERVPFDWLNWLFKKIDEWVKYLDGQNDTNVSAIAGHETDIGVLQVAVTGQAQDISDLFDRLTPIGTVLPFAGTTAPTNFLVCDGSTFSAVTYPDLNTLLGGNTLPNLKGKFLVGYNASDSDYNAMFKTGGQKNMPQHLHSMWPEIGAVPQRAFVETNNYTVLVQGGESQNTANAGTGSIADDNRPPFSSVNYIIRAK